MSDSLPVIVSKWCAFKVTDKNPSCSWICSSRGQFCAKKKLKSQTKCRWKAEGSGSDVFGVCVCVITPAGRGATGGHTGCRSRFASPVWGYQSQGSHYLWPAARSWRKLCQPSLRREPNTGPSLFQQLSQWTTHACLLYGTVTCARHCAVPVRSSTWSTEWIVTSHTHSTAKTDIVMCEVRKVVMLKLESEPSSTSPQYFFLPIAILRDVQLLFIKGQAIAYRFLWFLVNWW